MNNPKLVERGWTNIDRKEYLKLCRKFKKQFILLYKTIPWYQQDAIKY